MNGKANGKVFLEWDRGQDEVVRLMTQEFKGQLLVHLRIWSRGNHGELYPLACSCHQQCGVNRERRRVEECPGRAQIGTSAKCERGAHARRPAQQRAAGH
jgi:hypothetical protein